MKKETYLALIAIAAALLILAGLAAYLTLNFGDAVFTDETAKQTEAFQFQTEPAKEEPKADPQRPASGEDPLPDHLFLWVGDSRTLGMMRAVRDDCVYIGAAGEGYDWFVSTGEAQMRSAIAEHPDAPVIFNLGVNDYDNMELYLERYQALTEELSGTDFYFLSVNPIDPAVVKVISNEQIADFNSHLKEAFPDSYIDGFTYLMASEVVPTDGVHYDKEAYQMLHDFVVRQLLDAS